MATNRKFAKGSPLSFAVPSPTVSGDPVVLGNLGGGVALSDYDATVNTSVAFEGVYELSVKGANDAGNVAIAAGDPIYYVSTDTPKLSAKSSGVFFGYALEAVGSGATTAINVRLTQSGPSPSYDNSNIFISAETTGTGSSQDVAHDLGAIPSKVVFVLTEFLSNQSIDITPGSHTSSVLKVTVASGVKFQAMAFK